MIKHVVAFIQCDKCKEIEAIDLEDIDVNEYMIKLDSKGWLWHKVYICPSCQKAGSNAS